MKSANILLDSELNPHLSDSGIASFSPNADKVNFEILGALFSCSQRTFCVGELLFFSICVCLHVKTCIIVENEIRFRKWIDKIWVEFEKNEKAIFKLMPYFHSHFLNFVSIFEKLYIFLYIKHLCI